MAEIIRLRASAHDEARELIPWLVNGTLDPAEIERVKTHVAECVDCRSELASERRLAAHIAALPIEPDSSWERMKARLQRDAPVRFSSTPPLWRRGVPLGWAVASPFAAAAAVALLFVTVSPEHRTEPQYRALGAAPIVQPANLVVQFEPTTRVLDMQGALESVDARLVNGPTETGAYLLRVDQVKRDLALKRLRDNQAIALAEPIDGPGRQ